MVVSSAGISEPALGPSREGSVNALAISPDGRWLAAGTAARLRRSNVRGEVGVWDLHTADAGADPVRRLEPGLAGVYCLRVFAGWPVAPGGGFDGFLRVWDAATGKVAAWWPPGPSAGKIDTVAFAPDGQRVAAALEDDAVTVYPFSTPLPTGR